MKKFLLTLLFTAISINAQPLAVNFNATNNYLVTPTGITLKQPKITNIVAGNALVTDSAGRVTNSITTSTELGYSSGLIANIQGQINTISGGGGGTITNIPTLAGQVSQLTTYTGPATNVVDMILDTDIGGDIDDAGDLALFESLADQGEINPLAVMTPVTNQYSPVVIEVFNRYYGRGHSMIGVTKSAGAIAGADGYSTFIGTNTLFYKSTVNASFVLEAVGLYRKILATRPDNSVTIVLTGPIDNLYNLWNSVSDTNSALVGSALVTNKVREIVVAAGYWPTNSTGSGNNLTFNPIPAGVFNSLTNSTVRVTFVGDDLGYTVLTGGTMYNRPNTDPVRAAWYNYFSGSTPTTRPAWGQLAVLYGARGLTYRGTNWWTRQAGYSVIAGSGINGFTTNALANQGYLSYTGTPTTNAIGTALDTLLMLGPPNIGIATGQTNITGRFGLKYSDTNVMSINTNMFMFDSVNGRLKFGAYFTPDTFTPYWNDDSRLFVLGSNASTVLTNVETLFEAIRPQNGSTTFGQGFRIQVGRWKAPTAFSGDSEITFASGAFADIYTDSREIFVNNFKLRSSGEFLPQVQILAVDGTVARPCYSFLSETNTGFIFPGGSGAMDAVVAGDKSVRFFSGGLAAESTDGYFGASGVFGTPIDWGIARSRANTAKIVQDQAGTVGDLDVKNGQFSYITVTNTVTVGSGVAGSVTLGDGGTHNFTLATQTMTTNANIIHDSKPDTGFWFGTLSALTNETITHVSSTGSGNVIRGTNAAQEKVWVRVGVTNLGVFDNITFWPGTNMVITTTNGAGNTNVDISINSTASGGGGGGGGNVLNTGASVANQIPRYTDTTGTNINPSGATITGTNMNVLGQVAADNLRATNGLAIAGSGVGSITLGDADNSNNARVVAAATTVTNINWILPDRPYNGPIFGTISGGTNVTLSQKPTISTKTAAYAVLEDDNGTIINNTGTTAKRVMTLPAAAAGLTYTFCITDADGLDITAVGDDTIQYGSSITAAAGTITSTTKGSFIKLVAQDATQWFAVSIGGTWTP